MKFPMLNLYFTPVVCCKIKTDLTCQISIVELLWAVCLMYRQKFSILFLLIALLLNGSVWELLVIWKISVTINEQSAFFRVIYIFCTICMFCTTVIVENMKISRKSGGSVKVMQINAAGQK